MTPEQKNAAKSERSEACELLFELYPGATGPVQLGRLLLGKHAGRLVTLRPVSAEHALRAKALVDRVRHISHPKLLKLLGCFRIGSQDYLASEYIAGASFVELRSKLVLSTAKDAAVLVRITRDVLLAAHSGRRLLHGIYGRRVERCIFPDTIWVAEFGEVFITELGVFESLIGGVAASVVHSQESLETEGPSGRADVLAIGEILFDAIANRATKHDLFGLPHHVGKALTSVVSRALEHDGSEAFASATELAHALSNLPAVFNASTDDVRSVLGQAMQGALELRRRKLSLVEQTSAVGGDSDATQFHRASGLSRALELDTVRPSVPTGSGTHPTQAAALPAMPKPKLPAFASRRRAAKRPQPQPVDDATLVFRPPAPSDDDATTVWAANVPAPAGAMDEDATALYIASKQRPLEPSVIVQDHDASELYLRARTDVSGVRGASADEPTRLSVRASRERDPLMDYLQRRRRWLGVVLFMVLLVLSAGLTLLARRSGAF
ncbi:MAG TPA: hypothetical protein VFU02_18920 [Polyangiaceae bacterium]|nr:hypothetical protein [Polyangiaceae bacterium]